MSQHVLVTGGAGYIGSHTVLELLQAGFEVTVLDNLDNSCEESLIRVQKLTDKEVTFHKIDLLDKDAVNKLFDENNFDSVIHFAGLKAVGESVDIPLRYYHNNITGTIYLLEVMKAHNCFNIVFSSSATVYGDPATVPITEAFPLSATNPYGRTKLFIEEMMRDLCISDERWTCVLLRYFNPIGAHESGWIGEDPNGIPNNLMPYIMQVAIGQREALNVFGNDYDTKDGTGVRDYIHVVDLALGHLAALNTLPNIEGCKPYNLGTGNGYSVLEVLEAARKASGKDIPHNIVERRPGDVAECFADPSLAQTELNWQAERGIEAMCDDSWRWQSQNPLGYKTDD